MTGVLGIVFGAILLVLGAAMISNYRSWGTLIVEKTVPKVLRVGEVESHRKTLGYSYFGGGVLFIVVGIVYLAK